MNQAGPKGKKCFESSLIQGVSVLGGVRQSRGTIRIESSVQLRFLLVRWYLNDFSRGIRRDGASLAVHILAGIDLT